MSLKELTKEYMTKAVYHTPIEIMRLMAAVMEPGEGRVLDICGGSQGFLKRAGVLKSLKGEEELIVMENWTGSEDTCESRENLLLAGPREKVLEYASGKQQNEEYDYIYMNPPFGYTRGEARNSGNRLESQFLRQVSDCLKSTGRCAAVVPNGILTRTSGEDVELRRMFVEDYHVEKVLLLPISSFLPYAEVSTGILVFAREKGDGITQIYDLRGTEKTEKLAEDFRNARPVCILNRTALAQHQYILCSEEYLRGAKPDDQVMRAREKALKRRLSQLTAHVPSVYENEDGQIGLFPCQRGIQNRRGALKEILDCEYGLLECEFFRLAEKERWPEVEGSEFIVLKSGKRWDEAEKDGPFRVYGAAGIQGTSKTASMEEDTALLIGRVGSYCGTVYKAWTKGFVSDNVMLVSGEKELVEEDFLMVLLRAAHFNQDKRGSVQPYITKNIILKRRYRLPGIENQRVFLKKHGELLERLKSQEKEVEELSLAMGEKLLV